MNSKLLHRMEAQAELESVSIHELISKACRHYLASHEHMIPTPTGRPLVEDLRRKRKSRKRKTEQQHTLVGLDRVFNTGGDKP